MIVALGVIMVLTFLSVAVVARTLSGLKSTRQGQDFSAALANADAGVSDALFRMDQTGVAPAATFCVGPSPSCTVASVPGAPTVQYVARRDTSDPLGNTYIVESKGIVNGQPHAARAHVKRSYTYPFAIFAKTDHRLQRQHRQLRPEHLPGAGRDRRRHRQRRVHSRGRRRDQRPDHVPRLGLARAPAGLLQGRRHQLPERLPAPGHVQPAGSDAHVPRAREHPDDTVPAITARSVPGERGDRRAAAVVAARHLLLQPDRRSGQGRSRSRPASRSAPGRRTTARSRSTSSRPTARTSR